jgi:hypothetical protein
MSSEATYEQIESSFVFVSAPDGLSSGNGFVIDGGWIVTNAHETLGEIAVTQSQESADPFRVRGENGTVLHLGVAPRCCISMNKPRAVKS